MFLTFRPIQNWPAGWRDADRERRSNPFRGTYDDTLAKLDLELEKLDTTEAWVQVDVTVAEVRADGALRVHAAVGHPGVILTAQTKTYGTLTYACDTFEVRFGRGASWQANLRAIALGLEALRKVERYGIADRGQQYAGFGQLGTGRAMGSDDGEMDPERAARTLAEAAGLDRDTDPDVVRNMAHELYRRASLRYHPDKGGDAGVFSNITTAYETLRSAS